MRSTRCFLKLSPLFAAALLAACASPPAARRAKPTAAGAPALNQEVHLEGVLTDNGMGCSALRTPDGSLYTFARDLEGPKKGEHIWVDGYVTAGAGCRSGTNIMPKSAGLAEEGVADEAGRTTGRRGLSGRLNSASLNAQQSPPPSPLP